jgi:transposase-like protein
MPLTENSREIDAVSQLPNVPAVYAMLGGKGANAHVAYVGIAGKLKQRITQHLVRRDSSVTTGASAVSLNPNLVTEVWWWEHEEFALKAKLDAAELIAFEILNPALRSRAPASEEARRLVADADFASALRELFASTPAGTLVLPTLQTALRRIELLEERVRHLEEGRT